MTEQAAKTSSGEDITNESEVELLVDVEDRHWWYAERRRLVDKAVAGLRPGKAVDVGAAGGGNTRVLLRRGWKAVALEFGEVGARVCAQRGVPALRADATRLPLRGAAVDLVIAYDVLEHIEDDAAAASQIFAALRPGGLFLVAVPCDPKLWSQHDEAVGHVRRYTEPELIRLLEGAGFMIEDLRSWMVLLRPVVALRRRRTTGSDLDEPPRLLNAALRAVVAIERYLPVGRLPGVTLLARARRPMPDGAAALLPQAGRAAGAPRVRRRRSRSPSA